MIKLVWRAAVMVGMLGAHAAQAFVLSDIPYGPDPAQSLDICSPEAGKPPLGTVILIHGGGWAAGNKRDLLPLCRRMSDDGFVAININYRLVADKAQNVWPAQVEDLKNVLTWTKARDGIPPRFCLIGFSAGGHIALKAPEFLALDADAARSIKCIVANAAPTRLYENPLMQNIACRLVNAPDKDACAARSKELNPTDPGNGIAYMLVHGQQDKLVPIADSITLATDYRKKGVVVELVAFQGGHSFEGLSAAERGALLGQQIAFLRKILGGNALNSP